MNVIVELATESHSHRAPTTASHHCKAGNVPPIHIKVDYVFCDRLDRLFHGMPDHPPTTARPNLAVNTRKDASSGG